MWTEPAFGVPVPSMALEPWVWAVAVAQPQGCDQVYVPALVTRLSLRRALDPRRAGKKVMSGGEGSATVIWGTPTSPFLPLEVPARTWSCLCPLPPSMPAASCGWVLAPLVSETLFGVMFPDPPTETCRLWQQTPGEGGRRWVPHGDHQLLSGGSAHFPFPHSSAFHLLAPLGLSFLAV